MSKPRKTELSTSSFFATYKYDLIALLSAIPLSMSIQMVNSPLNWLVLVFPFLSGIAITDLKIALRRALIIAVSTALINFFWIMQGAKIYTGTPWGFLIGLLIVCVFIIGFCVYTGVIGAVYVFFQWKKASKYKWLIDSVLGGCLFVFMDAVMIEIGKGFSTCMFVNYISLAMNDSVIQYVAYLGPLFITFILAMTNYQIAYLVHYKKWKFLAIPLGILFLFFVIGNYIFQSTKEDYAYGKKADVALLTTNIPPSVSWDSAHGNDVVHYIFDLNKKAVDSKIKLVVWPETIVPWTYEKNDPFLQQLLQMSQGQGINHVIGINTVYEGHTFYNSLYSIANDGTVEGRYDKRSALYLVEKPFCGILLPFLSTSSFRVKEGNSAAPINTIYGKAGVLLCNESSIPYLAVNAVNEGATYIVNSGNDGWFSDTYITKQHFYHSRLRAVENRKYVLVNNNNGYTGCIDPTGNILSMEKHAGGYILETSIVPNNVVTAYDKYPYLILVIAIIIFASISIVNFKKNSKM